MKQRISKVAIGTSLFVAGFSTCAFAEDNADSALQAQVGLVAAFNSSFYQGADNDYYLLPLAIVEYKRFYLQGIDAGYHLYVGDGGEEVAIEVGRTFDGYESDKADVLSGMSERKPAWEAALVYKTGVGRGELTAKLMQDISGSHEGFSARMEYERPLWMNDTKRVTWYAGGEYWDSTKTDYYFGVKDSEERPNRDAYSASDSLGVFTGLNAIKKLSPKFSLIMSAEYRWASDAVVDSPLVTRDDQWSAYGGIFYSF